MKVAEKRLRQLGNRMLQELKRGNSPYIEIPVRALGNVYFDSERRLLQLGEKSGRRYFLNLAHAKKFMQTLLVASYCLELIQKGKHASLRDVYYALKRNLPNSKEVTFQDQSESNPVIEDLEVSLNLLREELHISADRKGYLIGNIVLRERVVDETFEIDASQLGTGGWGIPSNVEEIEFLDIQADYVLVIETGAMFERLAEERFWKKNNCLMVATKGQPSRGTRRLIHRLYYEANLPVYVFTDGDPYGWYIYSVIKQGSINLAYLSEKLGTPDAKFLGVTMSDVDKYNLHGQVHKLKEGDIKRAKELKDYPWFKNEEWQREINLMLEKKIRIEQQAFSSKSLEYVAEVYLPEKIEKEDFLP
ncbi:DNA topoisomerase VI [Thermococci archaeon]|nr:MAG: DNA topoisomerase VI [Thermococci archaeon]RLF97156.1 MAG: DNA topoisomerase VI [Thermococci archaeon]